MAFERLPVCTLYFIPFHWNWAPLGSPTLTILESVRNQPYWVDQGFSHKGVHNLESRKLKDNKIKFWKQTTKEAFNKAMILSELLGKHSKWDGKFSVTVKLHHLQAYPHLVEMAQISREKNMGKNKTEAP